MKMTLAMLAVLCGLSSVTAAERPNIIIFLADDKYESTEANSRVTRDMMRFRAELQGFGLRLITAD